MRKIPHKALIGLVKIKVWKHTKIRLDLMNADFPSIWLEIKQKNGGKIMAAGKLIEKGKTEFLQATYINDGSKLWNVAADEVTKSSSLWSAKTDIKTFVRTLPI